MNIITAGGQLLSNKTTGYWIGLNVLNKTSGSGSFQWSDNSPVSFTNWNTGQPDNFNNVEECAEMGSTGLWSDTNCYVIRGFICKIEKDVIPTSDPIIVPDTFPSKYF